jgi:predicted PurR-regulated permease PerM
MVPEDNRDDARRIFKEIGQRMGGWLRGQLLLAFLIGGIVALVLSILGIRYAGMIGLVAALAELVPMVGPAVAAIPTILVALVTGSTWQIIASIIFFTLLSQAENNYLVPRIMQKQVGLSPLTTILALLVGASLLGVVGALLAIPVAGAIKVFFTEIVNPAIRRAGESNNK